MKKQEIISRLKEGNQRYIQDQNKGELADSSRRGDLTSGQSPWAIVLSCADSRVVPEMAFDTGLGELFVVRVAGNVANTSSVASIEYAVAHLGTPVIVVMSHQACGAVTAAVAGGDNGYNLNHLLAHITPALNAMGPGAELSQMIKKNAELTCRELSGRSDIIRNAVESGKLTIVPAYYNLDSGTVDFL